MLRRAVVAADDLGDAAPGPPGMNSSTPLRWVGSSTARRPGRRVKRRPSGRTGSTGTSRPLHSHVWYIGTCCPLQGLPRGRGMRPVPSDRVRTRTRPERHETESEEENADCNSEETPHREPFPQRFSITREPSIRRGRLAHAPRRKPKAVGPTFRLSDQIRPMRRSTRRTIRTMPRTPMPR